MTKRTPANMEEVLRYWHYPEHCGHMRLVAGRMVLQLAWFSVTVLCRNRWDRDTMCFLRYLWTIEKEK